MKNSGNKRFGLIGDPIHGSLSPVLFKAAYSGRYPYDLIHGSDFETSYRKFLESYTGINVTAPFKEKAILKADITDPACRKTGAANILVKTGEGIAAYNSDYTGIIISLLSGILRQRHSDSKESTDRAVREAAFRLYHNAHHIDQETAHLYGRRPKALIAGCGGAGKAAAVAAGDLGLDTVLMNRTVEKAQAIAASLPEYSFRTAGTELFKTLFKESDIIIYTLPGKLDALGTLDESDWQGNSSGGKIILEANYKSPSFDSSVLSIMSAASPDSIYLSGKLWLLYQGEGYSIMTGETPDIETMSKTIL